MIEILDGDEIVDEMIDDIKKTAIDIRPILSVEDVAGFFRTNSKEEKFFNDKMRKKLQEKEKEKEYRAYFSRLKKNKNDLLFEKAYKQGWNDAIDHIQEFLDRVDMRGRK